jgi:hypothetical protein
MRRSNIHAGLFAAALVATTTTGHADDFDIRLPLRVGFDWEGQYRAPAVLVGAGLGVDFDAIRLSKRTTFEFVVDGDVLMRTDLPDTDRRSLKVRLAGGGGLVLRPRSSYAFVTEATVGTVFDAKDLIGVSLATTLYAYPAYLSWDEVANCPRSVLEIIGSGFAVWAHGAVDWTTTGKGGSLAFGASIDLAKFTFSPLISLASTLSRGTCR